MNKSITVQNCVEALIKFLCQKEAFSLVCNISCASAKQVETSRAQLREVLDYIKKADLGLETSMWFKTPGNPVSGWDEVYDRKLTKHTVRSLHTIIKMMSRVFVYFINVHHNGWSFS